MWYKIAKIGSTNKVMNDKLKTVVRESPFFQKLFDKYDVPIEQIEKHLKFIIKDIGDKYAKGNGKYIFINSKLFEDGDFFAEKIHYLVHEIVHWLTRQREKSFYFADPEEQVCFIYSMAYEILRGKSPKEIKNIFFPIIKAHFDKKQNAVKLFKAIYTKAKSRAEEYNK